jgi:glycosyltransferase involved in cell wall biosynthesis
LIRRRRFPQLLGYFIDSFLDVFLVLSSKQRYDLAVGIDNLNAFSGMILRRLRFVRRVIFYTIDFTPKRFNSRSLNSLYHAADNFCVRNSDFTWNVSERICHIRTMQGLDRKRNILVPIGIELDKIPIPSEKRDKLTLVLASYLTESKGAALAIEAIPELRNAFPQIRLEIIGTGPHERALKELVKNLGLDDCVVFLGVMDHDRLLGHLQTKGVGIATYTEDRNSISYYADPTKPKEYLACGLPVIVTWVPWIAQEINDRPMGVAIRYDKVEFARAVTRLLDDDVFYQQCHDNAIQFAASANWATIFDHAFSASS